MNVPCYFVDTNVLLYAVDARSAVKQQQAINWLRYLWFSDNARISGQVMNEFYTNAVRKLGVPRDQVRLRMQLFWLWHPGGFSRQVFERALYWADEAQVTHWDGLILASAEQQGCSWLLSEDFQAGRRYGDIEVINPFQTAPPTVVSSGRH